MQSIVQLEIEGETPTIENSTTGPGVVSNYI